jgi:hypothetical protein
MRRALIVTIVVALGGLVGAQQRGGGQNPPLPQPVQGDAILKDFRFRTGETLPELKIHYRTFGAPKKDAGGIVSNAVLVMHGTGGTGAQFMSASFAGELFGPGQALDASRYFVILPDGLREQSDVAAPVVAFTKFGGQTLLEKGGISPELAAAFSRVGWLGVVLTVGGIACIVLMLTNRPTAALATLAMLVFPPALVAFFWWSLRKRKDLMAQEHDLLSYATERLSGLNWIQIQGRAPGKGSIISFTMEGAHAHDVATLVDRQGVAVRAGDAARAHRGTP